MEYCDSALRAQWKFTVNPSEIGPFRKMHKKTCAYKIEKLSEAFNEFW